MLRRWLASLLPGSGATEWPFLFLFQAALLGIEIYIFADLDQLERDLTNHFDFCELAARFAKPAAALQTLIALGLLWRGHWWLLLLAAPLAAARIYALATSTYKLDPNSLLRADGRARQRRRQRTWLILHTVLCLFFLVNTGFFIFSVLRPTRLKLMRPVDIRW